MLNKLREYLDSEGIPYDVEGDMCEAVITITLPIDEVPLPEELQPFACNSSEVERAVWKCNTSKGSWG